MRIGLAQINPTLGDFSGNRDLILTQLQEAQKRNCDLCIFPEATVFGYHPFDLLERESLVDQQLQVLQQIHRRMPKGIAAIVGVITKNPSRRGRPYFNSAVLLQRHRQPQFFHKQLLPTGDVFDEARFIESGKTADNVFQLHVPARQGRPAQNLKALLTICEDIWAWPEKDGSSQYRENPLKKISGPFDLVVNLSASPFFPGKQARREELVRQTARHFKAPMLYVNMVGAQDEIIFDGGSFAVSAKGRRIADCLRFREDLSFFDLETLQGGLHDQKLSEIEELHQALVLGIRDFCRKTGLAHIHLGLSGGVDSALVACLAVDALGPAAVTAVAMPGPFSAARSLRLARQLAKSLDVRFVQAPIAKIYKATAAQVRKSFGVRKFGLVHENLQARLRGLLLMAMANAENSLLLSTSNKSEAATGYSTLYGDMCGGLAPIADLTKDQVYALCAYYNQHRELIPQAILDRAPSAELRPGQKDQDSLPPYSKLDVSVRQMIEDCLQPQNATDRWLIKKVLQTEFKRWQAPPILKVSRHSFGRGRRYPIAHRAVET